MLLLVAAVDCCCWDTACWPERLWIFPGYWWFCGQDNFAGEKVFEYFQDIDDLRLRQFCRRKSLWIFSPRWLGNKFNEGFVLISRWGWSEKGVRLEEIGQLTVANGWLKWECKGCLYPSMSQSSDCPIGERHRLSSGREVGVCDVNGSAHRFQNEVMSTYHVTSHVIIQAWCIFNIEFWANRVEPRTNASRNFAFPSSAQFQNFQLPFIPRVILSRAAPRLVNDVCSSFVKR